jgi:hypothetical protein
VLFCGKSRTILKDLNKEVGKGLLKSMCSNLGIDPREL